MHRKRQFVAVTAALIGGLLVSGSSSAMAVGAANGAVGQPDHPTRHVCATPLPGRVACHAVVRTDYAISAAAMANAAPNATPAGYGPTDLQSAYQLPTGSAGSGQTIAIIDAYDLPSAEADLATYRTQYGLPPCTTANGCFRKVDQNGGSALPATDPGWGQEIALDLDMVSAACPNCNILLVEASTPTIGNLGTAVNTAVALGAKYVSNSWGASEPPPNSPNYDAQYFNHPGVAITVSSGDSGYGVEYPASSRHVTAVGGTSLTRTGTTRGWSESAWNGAGSGCSAFIAKRAWQLDGGCASRTVADVAAVADPQTGVAVYDSTPFSLPNGAPQSGWMIFGGTSVSAPIIAGVYALAGTPDANTYPSSYPYLYPGRLNDVTTGSNGTCQTYLCTAGPGYDGPTGLGTPIGTAAFTTANDPIAQRYASLGGSASYLGDPAGAEYSIAGGLGQDYQYGAIYYSSATGAKVVQGAILDRYRNIGGPAGVLGFPTTDESAATGGRYNNFNGSGGSAIYWSSNTGAHSVQGAIYGKWVALGGVSGPGFPTTDESGTPDGVGRYNHFDKATSIYWSPSTGVHSVQGAIRDKWASLGWESGPMGYPTTDESAATGGRYNEFSGSGGSAIYWSSNTGAHSVQGAIYGKWVALGGVSGPGFPTTDESGTPDGVGRYNHFDKATSIYWSPSTGVHSVQGAIRDKWASLGWETSQLGYPTSDEFAVTGGRSNTFVHGTITWYSATNTTEVAYY